ncbi:MAG: hypothetical protein QW478_12570 [Candidatus Micrarchaeaceae archaeon]
MSATKLFIGIGIAILLVILIPSVIFPVFYIVFSPYLGCSPVGNANLLFTFNIFSGPSVSAICPSNTQIYYGLMVYTVLLISIISALIYRAGKYLPLVVIGAFLPSLVFFLQKLINISILNVQVIDIISIFIMIGGGILSWNES